VQTLQQRPNIEGNWSKECRRAYGCFLQAVCLGSPKSQHLDFGRGIWEVGLRVFADAFVNGGRVDRESFGRSSAQNSEGSDRLSGRRGSCRAEARATHVRRRDTSGVCYCDTFPLEQMSGECRLSVEMAAPNYAKRCPSRFGFSPARRLWSNSLPDPKVASSKRVRRRLAHIPQRFFRPSKGKKPGRQAWPLPALSATLRFNFLRRN